MIVQHGITTTTHDVPDPGSIYNDGWWAETKYHTAKRPSYLTCGASGLLVGSKPQEPRTLGHVKPPIFAEGEKKNCLNILILYMVRLLCPNIFDRWNSLFRLNLSQRCWTLLLIVSVFGAFIVTYGPTARSYLLDWLCVVVALIYPDISNQVELSQCNDGVVFIFDMMVYTFLFFAFTLVGVKLGICNKPENG